jgi:beta-galactosidase
MQIHAMGNGPGNIKEYIDAFYKYPTLQGGFAWEWANHGLLTKDKKTGDEFYAYGGDFGEVPHDSTFVMDGLVNSDHSPNAGLIEYKKAIEPVQLLEADSKKAKFINRYDFITLDHLTCQYTVVSALSPTDKAVSIPIPAGIAPGQTFELELPDVTNAKDETLVNISFQLKDATSYLEAGFETATAQISITVSKLKTSSSPSTQDLEIATSRNTLKIQSEKSTWTFNTLHGTLTSWLQGSTELISKAPELNFFRAPTDNDIPQDGWDWQDKLLHLAKPSTRKVSWSQSSSDDLQVVVEQRIAPPVLSWSIEAVITYSFKSTGELSIKVAGTPKGENLPRTLPRIGLVLELPKEWQNVKWFGRGPGESYSDSKLSQPIDLYNVSSIDELWVDYEIPQESSNRTDTRWLELQDGEAKLLAQFVAKDKTVQPFDWQATHYRMRDVSDAKHPYELKKLKREEVVLRLDYKHHGLGSGSCGPRTLDEYALLTEKFEFEILLQGA